MSNKTTIPKLEALVVRGDIFSRTVSQGGNNRCVKFSSGSGTVSLLIPDNYLEGVNPKNLIAVSRLQTPRSYRPAWIFEAGNPPKYLGYVGDDCVDKFDPKKGKADDGLRLYENFLQYNNYMKKFLEPAKR